MKRVLKVILVAGARPNFIKIAPLISAINAHNNCLNDGEPYIECVLVHTGQHYDLQMSETFFRELEIPRPDMNLEVGSGSHAVQTAEILVRFEKVCLEERPDWVLVVGDVNSTMACTLAAVKLGIMVGHVEAGLRSFDRTMPEEINRLVTDALSDLLFTPSADADDNLIREGISPQKIKRVGNVMIDTLIKHIDNARETWRFNRFKLTEKNYAFVTLHRPSNVDDELSLTQIMDSLVLLSHKITVVFPVHPRTRKMLNLFGLLHNTTSTHNLILHEPLGYLETIGLIDRARFVLTDSGGVQEETTFLGTPCLTVRPNTERPVTITLGTNKLTSLQTLNEDIENAVTGRHPSLGAVPELWDGEASKRILGILKAPR